MDPALRLLLGTALVVVLGWAPFACSGSPLPKVSPATQEALVVIGIAELRDRCTVLFADGDPPAGRARDACLVLMVLEPRESDDAPVSGDGGPMNVEQGNAVRSVDGGQ